MAEERNDTNRYYADFRCQKCLLEAKVKDIKFVTCNEYSILLEIPTGAEFRVDIIDNKIKCPRCGDEQNAEGFIKLKKEVEEALKLIEHIPTDIFKLKEEEVEKLLMSLSYVVIN